MAKIILGKPPKSFPKEVSFPMLDGTVGTIKVTYKYRTRKEFAAFVDAMMDGVKAEAEAELKSAGVKAEETKAAIAAGMDVPMDFGPSESETLARKAAHQVDYIMDSVDGWNLDIPFDREAVTQLADELPLAVTTIIESYRSAMSEGRLGN